MGENKIKKHEGGEKKNNGEVMEKKEGEGKKNDGNISVVLKSDCFDCCVIEVLIASRSVGGVEKVTCYANSKYLTVVGKVDPVTLSEKVKQKTQKYIELISPVPKKAEIEEKMVKGKEKENKIKKNGGGEKKNNGEVVEKKKGEGKKNDGNITVVLKSKCSCDCCVTEVVKAIRSVRGVEKVTCYANSKYLTVVGKVDPVTLSEKVKQKTQKYIELISPVPKKAEIEEKMVKGKEKEPPITMTLLKVHIHCQDNQKIQEIVTKFKGYKEMKVDKQKNLVTVTGSMDVKELVKTLK